MTNNNLVMWTKSRKSLLISILLLGATFSYAQTIQWTGGSGRYYITPTNTRIGIGTTNPLYNLDVRGTIRANEIIVNNVTGADFVFEKSYKLRPLSEVQSFIQKESTSSGDSVRGRNARKGSQHDRTADSIASEGRRIDFVYHSTRSTY